MLLSKMLHHNLSKNRINLQQVPTAYFNKDAERQIYRHSTSWLNLGSPQLEIDNNGKPYWVQTLYKSEFLSHRVNYRKLHVAVMSA